MPLNSHKPLYQPWNEEEFQSDQDVRKMDHLEKWMYRSLLQAAFFGPTRPYLPDDNEELWSLAGCESLKQWGKHKAKVLKKFEKFVQDGQRLLKQKRLEMDWKRERERRQTLANIGSKGGKATQEKLKATAQATLERGLSTELDRTGPNRTGPNLTEQDDSPMSLKTRITDTARLILHARLRPDDNQWPEVTSLARVHGPDAVLEAFESWAESKRGEDVTYPLSKFVEKADGIIGGEIQLKTDDRLKPLIDRLAIVSDGTVSFTQKQSLEIGKLLVENSPEEIETAFREFFRQIEGDQYKLKNSGKDFSEKAGQFLAVLKHRKSESLRQAVLLEAARELSESQGVQKMDDSELVEDSLGD